jgi:hypothetical protein
MAEEMLEKEFLDMVSVIENAGHLGEQTAAWIMAEYIDQKKINSEPDAIKRTLEMIRHNGVIQFRIQSWGAQKIGKYLKYIVPEAAPLGPAIAAVGRAGERIADKLDQWGEMSISQFHTYLERLRNSKQPGASDRADELESKYLYWKKKDYSDEDAIRKAFASVDMRQMNKRLGSAESEEEQTQLNRIKGHALTQHQRNKKFVAQRVPNNQSQQPSQQHQPEHEGNQSIGSDDAEFGRNARDAAQAAEERMGADDAEFGRNARDAAQAAEENDRELKLIIESYPIVQVSIEVFKVTEANPITAHELENRFPIRRVGDSIYAIVEEFRSRKSSFQEREDASKWLDSRLMGLGITNPGGISDFILEREFDKSTEKINPDRNVRLSGSGRWRQIGGDNQYLRPISKNYFTNLYLNLPRGKYVVSVPRDHGEYKFVEWRVNIGKRDTFSFDKNAPDIYLTEPTVMVAIYSKSYTSDKAKTTRYQKASGPGFGEMRGGLLGRKGVRERLEREVDIKKTAGTIEGKRDPLLLAAVNKGKRILNQYARAEYTHLFKPLETEYKRRGQELKQKEKDAKIAQKDLRKMLNRDRRMNRTGGLPLLPQIKKAEELINIADKINERENLERSYGILDMVLFTKSRDTLRDFLESRDKYYADYKRDMESAAAKLTDYMINKAHVIAAQIARQYRLPITHLDEKNLSGKSEEEILARLLEEYAKSISDDFVRRGRTLGFAILRGMGIASRGTETFSAAGMNLIQSTWDLVFGPWTWTTAFALVQFFFVLTYIGYNLQYLWIFPIIGAVYTFFLNFSDSAKPLDWITHLASGAIIGYSSLMLLIALGSLKWSFMGPITFWIVWAVLGFLGVMQFYQVSGWKVTLQGAIIILAFAWLALGPYSAYYNQAIGQLRAPIEIIYREGENAVVNIWLLATDPTEFYARQQVLNARPEHAIEFARGVELDFLEVLPAAVPAGQEFALSAVVTNEGGVKEPARDVSLALSCNQWCAKPPGTSQTENVKLCHNRDTFSKDEFYCAWTCDESDNVDPGNENLTYDACAAACVAAENSAFGIRYNCLTRTAQSIQDKQRYFYTPKLEKGESAAMNIRGFTALGDAIRKGETRLAKVNIDISYRYATTSSLLTEVMTQDEINKRVNNKEIVFRPVVATAKTTTARLHLNVGPQPLIASTPDKPNTVLLLVSVSSTRDDGVVRLPEGTKIYINLPKTIGYALMCNYERAQEIDNEKETFKYTVPRDVEILAYNFNSIFGFICEFNTAAVETVKTGLITAEISDYVFVLKKEKEVPITPPLGIIFNPYEKECNKCTGVSCDPGSCHAISESKKDYKCWYEDYGAVTNQIKDKFTETCHACSRKPTCAEFSLSPEICNEESAQCDLACVYDANAQKPSQIEVNQNFRLTKMDPTKGVCGPKVITGVAAPGTCSNIQSSYVTKYNTHKDEIATALSLYPLSGVQEPQALVAALISRESGWNERAYRSEPKLNDASYGLMQIVPSLHPECDSEKIKAYDSAESIKCGVRFLGQNIKDCSGSVEGALRKYNSGSCNGNTYDPNYVNQILNSDSTFKSGYNNWVACFQTPVQPAG